jgi:hypothetical protein
VESEGGAHRERAALQQREPFAGARADAFGDETRLPEPGFADDADDAAVALAERVDPRAQRGRLGVATDLRREEAALVVGPLAMQVLALRLELPCVGLRVAVCELSARRLVRLGAPPRCGPPAPRPSASTRS